MKLHFMIVRRVPPVPSPVLVECYDILRGRGYTVTEDIAEEILQRPDLMKVEADLYLLKSHTELSLALAGVLFTQGANMLNPYQSCSLIQSKIITAKLLRQGSKQAQRTTPRNVPTWNLSTWNYARSGPCRSRNRRQRRR